MVETAPACSWVDGLYVSLQPVPSPVGGLPSSSPFGDMVMKAAVNVDVYIFVDEFAHCIENLDPVLYCLSGFLETFGDLVASGIQELYQGREKANSFP